MLLQNFITCRRYVCTGRGGWCKLEEYLVVCALFFCNSCFSIWFVSYELKT